MFNTNFDGAIFKTENKSGIGITIQDHQGSLIVVLSQQVPCTYQVLEIEALAAARAVQFGTEGGVSVAMLEGDSEMVMTA